MSRDLPTGGWEWGGSGVGVEWEWGGSGVGVGCRPSGEFPEKRGRPEITLGQLGPWTKGTPRHMSNSRSVVVVCLCR